VMIQRFYSFNICNITVNGISNSENRQPFARLKSLPSDFIIPL